MQVATLQLNLFLRQAQCLKDKRRVIKSFKDKVRNRFNVSVAEVGGQDTWQIAVLGIATAAGERETARRRLEKTIDFIEGLHLAEVLDQEIEIL